MRPFLALGNVWIGLLLAGCQAEEKVSDPDLPDRRQILAKFHAGVSPQERERVETLAGLDRLRGFADGQTFLYRCRSADTTGTLKKLRGLPEIILAEPDQSYRAMAAPLPAADP